MYVCVFVLLNVWNALCILRRGEILRNQKREPSVDDAIAYFDSMATYIDELRKLQRELRHMIRWILIMELSLPLPHSFLSDLCLGDW